MVKIVKELRKARLELNRYWMVWEKPCFMNGLDPSPALDCLPEIYRKGKR